MKEFIGFPKISRFNRDIVVTEKIDGTNAQIYIGEDGEFLTGSRTRWITPEDDNFGFSRWAHEHKEELLTLGVGSHFGEWWGSGIQRRYGLAEKRFSLFNTERWSTERPACCHVVPILYQGPMSKHNIDYLLSALIVRGSLAAPGFMKPEGIVIYHTHARTSFKVTLEGDDTGKGA